MIPFPQSVSTPRGEHLRLVDDNLAEVNPRRQQILDTAAELFAERGYHGVSVADLGAACGVSGPALYKHFSSKEAMLAEMLISISEELLSQGRERVRRSKSAEQALQSLVDWHIEFALGHRALIIVQDRDWSSLTDTARERVRALQREYVELWALQLRRIDSSLRPETTRAVAHVVFGLINSTPRIGSLPEDQMRELLRTMALRSMGVPERPLPSQI